MTDKSKDIFADIEAFGKEIDTTAWEGTMREYIKMVQDNPKLAELAHSRILSMIESAGIEFDEDDTNKLHPKYKFFKDDLFGMDIYIHKVVKYLKAAASGSQVGRRILLLYGPTSSGKSQLASLLKSGLEEYSKKPEGSVYSVADCPMHENPLNLVPIPLRKKFSSDFGIKIDPMARPCPVCQLNLEEKYKNWLDVPVKRIFMSEMNRKGIGTFLPSDSKSQSITELVGSVDFSKLADYGVESDPRAYKFDGELNVANRGIMEMIEMLKVDPKFLYVLLTLAQEKTIKTERFPLIYADEFLLAHSVTGDTPIPYLKDGQVGFATIEELTEKNDTDVKVMAVNLASHKPEWTAVKAFISHPFTGKLIRTIQKNGIVDTTFNHSIYSTDYECFYPEDKKNVLAMRTLPQIDGPKTFCLELPKDAVLVEDNAYIKERDKNHGNGQLRKHFVKCNYNIDNETEQAKDILKVFAWYITEGHVNASHAIISQANFDDLVLVKKSVENISSSKASLQPRQDKEDKTSRLHLSTEIWKKIIQENCGKYSDGKKMPNFVFNLPDSLKMFFFNEMLKGDGTRKCKDNASEEYKQNHFSYKTTSKMLAAQVGFLLSQLKIDYSVYHDYTNTGKESFDIKQRTNDYASMGKNKIETFDVEGLKVYDIECVENHSFMGGVGNVILHNTNESEYKRFLSDPKLEALHDRIIVHKFPYNLTLDEEVKIYEKLVSEADFGNVHIAPLTLKVASMFAVLSRLEVAKDQNLTLLKKMQLYNKEDVEGFTQEDVKNIKDDVLEEGMKGISPRYIFNCVADCFTKYNMSCITPIDMLRSIKDNFESNAKLNKEEIERLDELLTIVVEQYSSMAKTEVQRAFFVNFETEIENLLSNYIDEISAFLDDGKVEDEFGEYHEPNERLMRSIEEKVNVGESQKQSFRQEILRKMLKNKADGKFNYKNHAKLREALEKYLFDSRSDMIRMTCSGRVTEPEALQKLNQVIDTLVTKHNYSVESANALLRFVSSLMAKTT